MKGLFYVNIITLSLCYERRRELWCQALRARRGKRRFSRRTVAYIRTRVGCPEKRLPRATASQASEIDNVIGQGGDLLPSPLTDTEGIFDADDPESGENELRLDGNGLAGLKRRSEPLGKNGEFIEFEADPMTNKLGVFPRGAHEVLAEPGRIRHLRRLEEQLFADGPRFEVVHQVVLNGPGGSEGPFQLGSQRADDEHPRHVHDVAVEDAGVVDEDRRIGDDLRS